MTGWTRRQFGIRAATLSAFAPLTARGQAKPKVVVVGGGVGGATVAKYLASGTKTVDVTLVEPKSRYTTCIFSNLYLAGHRSLESLTHGYETLRQRYGITIVCDSAAAIDPEARRVRLETGESLPYDRLVVSPGIAFAFGEIDGYDEAATEVMPHAWKVGPQTRLLRAQLEAMEDGGVFVIAAPPDPFRCPPAPYERASLAAYYFKQFKPRSKVLILDAKDSFFQQEVFQDGWNRHYPGMIEWLPYQVTGGITAVDLKATSIRTANETFKATVANVIPRQVAGDVARRAGLADPSGWCPVDSATFESRLRPGIHVIGDAANAGAMPKSASCANSQAKACAAAILSDLTGSRRAPPHLFDAGYTFLAGNDVMGDATTFRAANGTIGSTGSYLSKVGDDRETRKKAVREAAGWYDAFTQDVFG